jgi:trk system potassium uptake protein TrkA
MPKNNLKNRYITVIGCGRLGAHLADQLSRMGASVVVIDRDNENFFRLTQDFSGFTIEGEAAELSVLKQAKIGLANALVAVTGNDNVNIAAVQIAKELFGVPNTIARIKDEELFYGSRGIQVVSPVSLLSTLLIQVLSNSDQAPRRNS